MALLVFPRGLMALSPQEPLTLLSTRAPESSMARSAWGICPGQRCLTRVNQEDFSIQITCPGLSSLVALCPSAQDKNLILVKNREGGVIRALGALSSQFTVQFHWKAVFEDHRWDAIFPIPHPESTLWDKKGTMRSTTLFRKTAGATDWLLFFVSSYQDEQLTQVSAFVPRATCQPVNGVADLLPHKSMKFCATNCQ